MAVAWLGTVATAAVVRGRRFAAELVVLVAGVPGVWLAFANGTDFATFALVLTALAIACESKHRAMRAAALVLSVPVSQFRFPFFAAPALFADAARPRRNRHATLAVALGLVTWAAFVAWDLGSLLHDGPLNVVRKASGGTGGPIAAALALATGRAPRLSAAVLAASLLPTTAVDHRFWEAEDDTQRDQHRLHFIKNVSVVGGLIIAAGDTDGRPGIAWRARRAARDARREARHLATAARKEARLAKAKVS
jgi:uncharacterized membrane protein YphA (DoxX/SURF4 family)